MLTEPPPQLMPLWLIKYEIDDLINIDVELVQHSRGAGTLRMECWRVRQANPPVWVRKAGELIEGKEFVLLLHI